MKNHRGNLFFRFLLSGVSGILFVFAFPPFDMWQFAFVSFIPLLRAGKENDVKNFFLGFTAGIFFYSVSFSWLYGVAGPLYLLLPLYLSIYWGLFLYLIFALPERGRIFTAGFLWFLLEINVSYLLTGFPWLLAGLSQWNNPYLLETAGLFGIYGLSFLVITGNFTLFYSFRKKYITSWCISILIFAVIVFFPLSAVSSVRDYGESLRVMVVQPNVDSRKPRNYSQDMEKAKRLTAYYLKNNRADIVVWPEGIYHDIITADIIHNLKKFTGQFNTGLIVGTFTETGIDEKLYNSAVLIEEEALQIYNKTHLVPFCEFLPGERLKVIRDIFYSIAGYIPYLKKANELVPLYFRDKTLGVIICYENIFPGITASLTEKQAGLFIVITNDSWFGKSAGPYQHFMHNSIRAVETGRYFVQSALTGISGIVSPDGTIKNLVQDNGEILFIEGVVFYDVPMRKGTTLYVLMGNIPMAILSVIFIGTILCKKT